MFEPEDDPATVSDFGKHVWISSTSSASDHLGDEQVAADDSAILAIYSIKKTTSKESSYVLNISLHLIMPVEGAYKAFKLDVGIEDVGFIVEDSEGQT